MSCEGSSAMRNPAFESDELESSASERYMWADRVTRASPKVIVFLREMQVFEEAVGRGAGQVSAI